MFVINIWERLWSHDQGRRLKDLETNKKQNIWTKCLNQNKEIKFIYFYLDFYCFFQSLISRMESGQYIPHFLCFLGVFFQISQDPKS